MAGFIRRYSFQPPVETIRRIEGVIIVDTPPPGFVEGIETGVVGMVGEFADMTYATTFNTAGVISASYRPQQIFSPQDLADKFGGFDQTLGDFDVSGGNGFLSLRNKRFTGLVVAAVNLASAQGARVFRDLPVCTSQSDTLPVVPVAAATVAAGREFQSGAGRIKVGRRVIFLSQGAFASGTGGTTNNGGGAAATQDFDAAGGFDWTTDVVRPDGSLGALEGDILVIGNNNAGALQPLPAGGDLGAGTYRVAADPSPGTTIAIERLDGANFDLVAAAGTVPWRLHLAGDADSAPEKIIGSALPGGYSAADAGGYIVPVRPITDSAGAQIDGTYTAGTVLSPAVAPAAVTGDSADPLSGLGLRLHPSTATDFTAAVQGLNPASSASIDALYVSAIDAFEDESGPPRNVKIFTTSRQSDNIRTKLRSHVLTMSERGLGRMAIISPPLSTTTVSAVLASADPGVAARRDERVIYAWPGVRHFVSEAVDIGLPVADGSIVTDGVLDEASAMWHASLLSNLPPENNPGQASAPVPTVFSPILGLQRSIGTLGINEYIALRDGGVAAMRIDRTAGPIIQSGITTNLTSGQTNINRRRMADFIQESLAERLVGFSKQLLRTSLKDQATGETDAFLDELLSVNNPAAQRISAYQVDDVSGNTPELEAKGIFVIIVRVRTLASADFIVLQTEIGEGVSITELAA